jgi:2-(1,2-epoxy-1,2-dihydrophenyl)acetyl-CoA isomerase
MGYSPDAGGTWLMPRLIGLEAAKRFAFTAETWLAPEALERGLITEMHPADALEAAGMAFARKLAGGPTVAIRHAKRLMQTAGTRSLAEQLREERKAGEDCGRSEDAKEALAAAVERREPAFKGR